MCNMSRRCDCGPLCLYRIMPFLEGFVIIVLGVFLFMTNFGFMDASIWKWLFPLVIMLVGFKWITTGAHGCDCCDDDAMEEYEMMCCDDEQCEDGEDACCSAEGKCDDEKGCDCAEECACDSSGCTCMGECRCEKTTEGTEDAGCGCGGNCGCGKKE